MNRHLQGPVLDVSEQYRRSLPIRPDTVVALDSQTWVTHWEGMGALCKRKRSGTHWAVETRNRPPRKPR